MATVAEQFNVHKSNDVNATMRKLQWRVSVPSRFLLLYILYFCSDNTEASENCQIAGHAMS